ncbi:MAG TPA: DnaB-like helicase C-terminal domain-containing protein, partial [Saprospiraceae bacterium]|nr:DnaB-like helicase C-terminal domain-containing protein [Saprospiraceae bacterium]
AGFDGFYGGRTSAGIDIATRDGNKKKLAGFAAVSPFAVRGLLETPIKKFQEGKTSISTILSYKKSLIQVSDNVLYKYASSNDSIGLPFDFQDLYGKISIDAENGSSFNFFGFNFSDVYNNPLIANINWKNKGVGANFKLVPPYSTLIVDGTIGWTNYATGIIEGNDQPRLSEITELGGNINFNYYAALFDIKYGIDFRAISTDFSFTNPFGFRLNQNQNTSELGAFFKIKYNFNSKLIFEPSMRIMYYAGQQTFSPEPRFNLKYNIADDLRFKMGTGLYSQNIISTSNDRDIVNIFNGFLTGPEEPVLGVDGQPLSNRLVKARHLVGGFEKDLQKNHTLTLEGYYKDFPQIIIVNRNKLSNEASNYATEEGYAYGVDLSLKSKFSNFDIWATYSYGYVRRFDGLQEYPAVFDRRHNANIVLSYYIDEAKKLSLSRGVRGTLHKAAEALKNGEDPARVLSMIQSQANELVRDSGRLKDANIADYSDRMELLESRINNPDGFSIGVPSGITTIDSVFGGFQPGDFVVVIGWTGTGKSSLTRLFAANAWRAGYRPLIISLEMDRVQEEFRMDTILNHGTTFKNSQLTNGIGITVEDLKAGQKKCLRVSNPSTW